jgi:hypothetical protein
MTKKPDKPAHPFHDRRCPDPWKDEVDSGIRFLRKSHIDLNKKVDESMELIVENTQITKKLGEKLDHLVEDTYVLVKGTRAVRRGSKFAMTAAVLGSKVGRVGLFFVGCGALVIALLHGARWSEAWDAFVKYVLK